MSTKPSGDTRRGELKVAIAALVVSVIAILFSQVRPLHEFFEAPDLSLAVAPNIEALHILGHLQMTRYITVSNTGHRAGTVVRAQMFLVRLDADGFEKVLPAAYVASQPPQFFGNSGSVQVPWHPVTIGADGDWSSYVSYLQPYSTGEVTSGTALVGKAASELPPVAPANAPPTAQITDETFNALSNFVDKNLGGFGTGQYGVLTYFWENNSGEPKIDQCDIVDVSDVHMKTFHDIVGRYRTGIGLVYSNNGPIPAFSVNTRGCDSQTWDKMKKRLDGHKPL